jgi:argininosuccinate lyase
MASDIYREGRLGSGVLADVVNYISSYSDDVEIFDEIVKINMAHVIALHSAGYISREDAAAILRVLSSLEPGMLSSMPKMEDAHMAVEARVLEGAGIPGGNLNLGKSRNDQVAAAIRMRLRSYLVDIVGSGAALGLRLIDKSRELKEAVMPGFTHLQPAQPVTLGYLLLAHAEEMLRDLHRLVEAYNRVNLSPLGAAAMSGSTVRLNRHALANMLGFKDVLRNAVDAVSSRDYMIESLAAMLSLALSASRLAEHMVLWSSPEFAYIEIPDEYAATSSIMPHKKNPVVAELARAKAASPLSSLVAVAAILKSLPYSYNLDLQAATPYLWSASKDLLSTLNVLSGAVSGMRANRDRMLRDAQAGFVTGSDLAEYLTVKFGVPFRAAHRIVGRTVRRAVDEGAQWGPAVRRWLEEYAAEEGYEVRLSDEELASVLDPVEAVRRRGHVGMSGESFDAAASELESKMRHILSWRDVVMEELKKSQSILEERARAIMEVSRHGDKGPVQ